ncbi:7-cyano-7-deazaguanine synthase QueC [Spongiactinospora sp. TRM90649]|uniref:7-cyano-7-deazaguanine synthase QueC n=1 Tax=Spongiactinospora sp. TRM90649 TaxID=3031114 RepID=UPI0023F7DA18|nr:7-cyano-7-deazaguanine synthase QueC [Spongiactinospora sp. TRM90649]MDF5759029.1 7-cyano-7-deazaguanine synthase QueC [Spongiactinospora sp. TRM90649]
MITVERQADHAIVVASGGLDSTTLAYWLRSTGAGRLTLLGIDYAQRHRVELARLPALARALDATHVRLDLRDLGLLLAGSALTDHQVTVPAGHYTDDSMRATVVPNRNALLLDIAVALAVSSRADTVAFGAHAGDHPIYPDCRPPFLISYRRMTALANEGLTVHGFQVVAPFMEMTKAEIVRLGADLDVPFADTWSCYQGGPRHCGRCGTCTERKEAFRLARVPDPTDYESPGTPCM